MIYFATRDPRTPYFVRLPALLIAAYALSPIDLIPDFIPFIGYLDDILIIPLGIALVVRLTPQEMIEASRGKAALFYSITDHKDATAEPVRSKLYS